MTTYLCNAFSLSMIDVSGKTNVTIEEVSSGLWETVASRIGCEDHGEVVSAVGHADTAAILGVPCNRCNVKIGVGDVALVAQLQGGRLPEGSKTLPAGFTFKFYTVKLQG